MQVFKKILMRYYKNSFYITSLDDSDFIFVKNILSSCVNFEIGGAGYQKFSPIRNSEICWVKNLELNHLLFKYINNINASMYWNWNIEQFDTLQYTKYRVGNYYNYHIDESGWCQNKQDMRKISFSLLLNDDYEGGEFELEQLFMYNEKFERQSEFKKFKLKSNSLIVFHSDLIHKVHPVYKGVRESLVGWVSGPAFV